MICVTGASGTLSSEVIRQLEGRAIHFALPIFERAAEIARPAESKPSPSTTTIRNASDAFHACDRLFLLGPNALNQTELELNAVDAAKAAGVRHIVKQSVMGAADEAYSLAKIHRPAEKAIETSGLAWTFLRPNSFMQNAVTFMAQTIRAEGAFYSASGQARISHVDVVTRAWRWRRSRLTATTGDLHPERSRGMTYTRVMNCRRCWDGPFVT